MRRAVLALALIAAASAARAADDGVHVGVATCAGDNCHGRADVPSEAQLGTAQYPIKQNEYLVWAHKDKHARAYAVLKEPRGERIAHNLGLANAETAAECLSCHTDSVPPARRGPRYRLADGVGCEACHGGAVTWLGTHIAGLSHQDNLAAGLYPTERPEARAERCLSCHIGGGERAITHRIMGAGHPPMPFELDTFTAIQPAHFTVTARYAARKGRPNDVQIWAVGQAVDLQKRMALLTDPANAPKGATPELVLFDCQACHHAMNQLQWQARGSGGPGPGTLRLYDATAVMLEAVAARVAPDLAKDLAGHLAALHRAAAAAVPDYWAGVQRAGAALGEDAGRLAAALAAHDFTAEDAQALARAVISSGDLGYSAAQQETMALESIVAAMKAFGWADASQVKALNDALGGLYEATADDQTYRPENFAAALRQVEAKLPH